MVIRISCSSVIRHDVYIYTHVYVMTFIMQVEILTYLCHTYDARTPDFMNGDITIAITLNVNKQLSLPPTLNVKKITLRVTT